LDIEGIDALMEACKSFKGGIISISHDERFISGTANQVRTSQRRKRRRKAIEEKLTI
jgi:ATPase subunit of ABC transporter with duplicated ATPase domains